MMPEPAGIPNRRWWVWLPLLLLGAWLALFGDKTPNSNTAELSLPTRVLPAVSAVMPATAKPGVKVVSDSLESLVPREQLIGTSSAHSLVATERAAMRNLFVSKNWNPPLPPVPLGVAAPVAPPLPFVFLGKKLEGDSWEVYLSRGEQTFIAREGMTIDSNYRVGKIIPPALTLTYIPLGQAQPLSIGDTR